MKAQFLGNTGIGFIEARDKDEQCQPIGHDSIARFWKLSYRLSEATMVEEDEDLLIKRKSLYGRMEYVLCTSFSSVAG